MALDRLTENPRLPFERDQIVRGGDALAQYLAKLIDAMCQTVNAEERRMINSILSITNAGIIYLAIPDDNGVYPTNSMRFYVDANVLYLQSFDGSVWNAISSVNLAGLLTTPDVKISSPSEIYDLDHDSFAGFVANEHIDHTAVSILAGTGLTGGGTIAANRTLALSWLGLESLTDPGGDRILFWDETDNAFKWLSCGNSVGITTTTLDAIQDIRTSASPTWTGVRVGNSATIIQKDGSGNMTLTDAVVGTRTLKQLGCPTYKYIKATGQPEGDLHLSDGTNWAISKALIKYIRVVTASTNWSMWILQNDNGYAANDAVIPRMKIADGVIGNANLWLDLPYQDEDASNEVHLYWTSASGVDTADIYNIGYELL